MASAGKTPLKVLFLSPQLPYPLDTGGKIRTAKLLEKLKDSLEITLISNVEHPNDDPYLPHVRRLCADFHPVPWTRVKKHTLRFYTRLLTRAFSRHPVAVINDLSRDLEATIFQALQTRRYDLLVCDFLQPSANFSRVTGYPTLLFQHNVESVLVKRYLDAATHSFARLFWWSQLVKMERYERSACHRFTAIATVSEIDKKILEERFSARNVFAIPTGIDSDYFSPRYDPVEDNSLVFTGSMDWFPNEDAILFFTREILGQIKEHIPTVKLTVVGRNPSRRLLKEAQRNPEIRVVGRVEDIRPFISRHALYVIPLRIGGGTRIKAYEAMAMGKAVVSTPIGTEGLPVNDGEHVILAAKADDFARAVVKLLRNPQAARRIGAAAREFVKTNFSWEKAAAAFADICWRVVYAQRLEARCAHTLQPETSFLPPSGRMAGLP